MKSAVFALALYGWLVIGTLGQSVPNADRGPRREVNVNRLPQLVGSPEARSMLEDEFLGIPGGKRRNWTVGESPENKAKNRYDDLLAFDDTRVKLRPSMTTALYRGPTTDYINANYLDGYNYEREYIATQGPLPNTVVDFWRMVWQENASSVVMLSNIVERNKTKVHKYWPDGDQNYAEFTVTLLAEHEMPDVQHTLRIFKIKKEGVMKPRRVRHFHFRGWPDLGVPNDLLTIVALMRQARLNNPLSTAPIIVHCSPGVGRSGTAILLDSMLQRARAEGVVDFPRRLDHMRTQRVDLVETKEQYVYAHEAVNEVFNNPSAQQYLRKVQLQYEEAEQEAAFASEVGSPSEFPHLLRQMDWHVKKMRELVQQFRKEYKKDLEMHEAMESDSSSRMRVY